MNKSNGWRYDVQMWWHYDVKRRLPSWALHPLRALSCQYVRVRWVLAGRPAVHIQANLADIGTQYRFDGTDEEF